MKKKNEKHISGATVFAVFAILFIFLIKISEDPNPLPKKPAIKEKKIQKSREDLLADSFSTFDGRHILLVHMVKKLLLDPSSFSHIRTWYKKSPEGRVEIYMMYRAKNGFGALTIHNISAIVHISKPNVILSIN